LGNVLNLKLKFFLLLIHKYALFGELKAILANNLQCNFSCVICGFDHAWKNNYMMIITGTLRVKIMVERGNIFEPICSPSA